MKTSKAGFAKGIAAVGVVALALMATACDEEDSGSGIDSTEEFCASVKDIDDRFFEADMNESGDDFETQQAAYREINERLDTLADSMDVVDEESRDAVAATIDWGIDLTNIIDEADSVEELEAALFAEDSSIWAEQDELDPAGEEWISDTCNVDINDEG